MKKLRVLTMSNNNVREWVEFGRLAELPALKEAVFIGSPPSPHPPFYLDRAGRVGAGGRGGPGRRFSCHLWAWMTCRQFQFQHDRNGLNCFPASSRLLHWRCFEILGDTGPDLLWNIEWRINQLWLNSWAVNGVTRSLDSYSYPSRLIEWPQYRNREWPRILNKQTTLSPPIINYGRLDYEWMGLTPLDMNTDSKPVALMLL